MRDRQDMPDDVNEAQPPLLPGRFLTSAQTAELLGITARRLRKIARSGYIRCKFERRRYYFRRNWIEEYLSAGFQEK